MKLDTRTLGRALVTIPGCISSVGSALAAIVFAILHLAPSVATAQEVLATIPVGSSPFGVAINESTNRIYVANTQGSSVSVIDGSSNQVIATIPVGARPYSVAVNPNTNRVYVSHLEPNSGYAVDVIDGTTNSVVAVLGVGYASVGVAVNPTTNRVYYGNALTRAVEVYDGATNNRVAVVTMPGGPFLAAITVNPTTNLVYVGTTSVPCQVYVIDGSSNIVVATVLNPFGNYVPQLAINVGTNLLYVPSFSDDHVLVVDGATNNVLRTLSLPDCIYAAANPASNLVHFGTYNVNGGVNSIVTVNAMTHDVVSNFVFDVNPSGINAVAGVAVNSSTNMIYVSNRLRNNVTVLSEPTVSSLPEITSPPTASGIFNEAFSYTITATNTPDDFDALGLPTMLGVNNATGEISGIPSQVGVFPAVISAANAAGVGIADLEIAIAKAQAGVSLGDLLQAFDGSPKAVSVITTPGGLSTDVTYDGSVTPPTVAGSYAVVAEVSDANYSGSASDTLTLTALVFNGFHAPIGGSVTTGNGGSYTNPLRAFKLGSTIPVKFSISTNNGPFLTGIHTLQVFKMSNATDSDVVIDATPTDSATTGNQFRLNGSDWHFNLSTQTGFSEGTWRIVATLADDTKHDVWITIK